MEWILLGLVAILAVGVEKGPGIVQEVEKVVNRPEFKKQFLVAAGHVDLQGLPASIALAHADLESGAGTGSVFAHTKNLFSITVGSGWKGHWNGKAYKAASGLEFRSYDSWEDSIRDWVQLMHFPIYKDALGYGLMGNIVGFANEIKRIGYDSTDDKYAQDLISRFNADKGALA